MPHFTFQISGSDGRLDQYKRHLPNAWAARCEAAKTIGTMICDAGAAGGDMGKFNITVRDSENVLVFGLQVTTVENAVTPIETPVFALDDLPRRRKTTAAF